MKNYDVTIIGAGIVGGFLAYDLSKYNLNILVIDKENDVANVTSMANSAVIHTGYDPEDNTLKAKLNCEGARMYEDICSKLHVSYNKIGALIVKKKGTKDNIFNNLVRQAKNRNVRYEILEHDDLHKLEPNLSDNIEKAISFMDTAIIDPMVTTVSLFDVAITNGITLKLNKEVIAIEREEELYKIICYDECFITHSVINASGLGSSKIANMVGDYSYEIVPRIGEYFVLDKQASHLVNQIIFPLPDEAGKGVLAIPTTHHNTLLGPTSFIVEEEMQKTTREGLNTIRTKLNQMLINVPYDLIIRSFTGIRATVSSKDFIIEEFKGNKNFINLGGIDSPGIASAPAISKYVINNFIKPVHKLELSSEYTLENKEYYPLNEMSIEQRNEMISKDDRYGNIICRCEKISEAEIMSAIHRPCGATTIKGVKKRVRAGMGRCQSGFCENKVLAILARELNKEVLEINYDSNDSKVLYSKSKGANYE